MSQVQDINTLARYLGLRDISSLTQEDLYKNYSISQVDVMVLFGGSILCGADVLAKAMKNHIAKKYIIVGGAGHTTQTFREKVYELCPYIEVTDLSEAEIFNNYIQYTYGLRADYLETHSTNCGNNITYLLDLIKDKNIECNSILLMQDATMQRRMDAILRKFRSDLKIINYASYSVNVLEDMKYSTDILGMWKLNRYIELLMGEIPRLYDDENGYGPKGKDFLVHVDIPKPVLDSFWRLKEKYQEKYQVREANSKYASKDYR